MRVSMDVAPTLGSYESAVAYYKKIKPWRGDPEGWEKPIDKRSKRHMTIRIGNNQEVRCKLYRTDVVVYHPDGSMEFVHHGSVSTDAFVRAIAPGGFYPHYTALGGTGVMEALTFEPSEDSVKLRYYQFKHSVMTFDPCEYEGRKCWRIDESDYKPFSRSLINQKVSRKVLAETNYKNFATWVNARHALEKTERRTSRWSTFNLYRWDDAEKAKAMLAAGFEQWIELYDGIGGDLNKLRMCIYKGVPDITTEIVKPWCHSLDEVYSFNGDPNGGL